MAELFSDPNFKKWLMDYFANQEGLGPQNAAGGGSQQLVDTNVNSILDTMQSPLNQTDPSVQRTTNWFKSMYQNQTNPQYMAAGAKPAGGTTTNYIYSSDPLAYASGQGGATSPVPKTPVAPVTPPAVGAPTPPPVSVEPPPAPISPQATIPQGFGQSGQDMGYPTGMGGERPPWNDNPAFFNWLRQQGLSRNQLAEIDSGVTDLGTMMWNKYSAYIQSQPVTGEWVGNQEFPNWLVHGLGMTEAQIANASKDQKAMDLLWDHYQKSMGKSAGPPPDEFNPDPNVKDLDTDRMSTTAAYRTAMTNWLGKYFTAAGYDQATTQAKVREILNDPTKYRDWWSVSKSNTPEDYAKSQQKNNSITDILTWIEEYLRRIAGGPGEGTWTDAYGKKHGTDSGQFYEYQGKIKMLQDLLNSQNKTGQSTNPFGWNYQQQFTDPTGYYKNAGDFLRTGTQNSADLLNKGYEDSSGLLQSGYGQSANMLNQGYETAAELIRQGYDPAMINRIFDTSAGNLGARAETAAGRAGNVGAALGGSRSMVNPEAYASNAYSSALGQFMPEFGNIETSRAGALNQGNQDMFNKLSGNQVDLTNTLAGRRIDLAKALSGNKIDLSQRLGSEQLGLGKSLAGNETDLFNALFGVDAAKTTQTTGQQQLQLQQGGQNFDQAQTLAGLGELFSTARKTGWTTDLLQALSTLLNAYKTFAK